MDIQGYITPKEDHAPPHHYASVPSDRLTLASASDYKTGTSIPSILPTLVEEEYNSNDNSFSAAAAASATTPTATSINHLLSTPIPGETLSVTVAPPPPQSTSSTMAASPPLSSSSTFVTGTDANASLQQQNSQGQDLMDRNSLNPALLLPTRFDKRKSSPAILGLPFGLNHEAQLSLHLSQQRNSIEAAMLLANFTKSVTLPKASELDHKGHPSWQDDMSVPSQNKTSWGDVLASESEANRRHSYDVNMSWQTMPAAFLERADLFPNMSENISASSSTTQSDVVAPLFEADNDLFKISTSASTAPTISAPTKVSWSHEDLRRTTSIHDLPQPQQPTFDFSNGNNHPMSPRQQQQHDRLFHPSLNKSLLPPPPSSSSSSTSSSYQQHRYIPPPPSLQQQPHPQDLPHHHHHGVPMLHPLARQPENGIKNEFDPHQPPSSYYSYTFPPQPPSYHYSSNNNTTAANGKLPLPTSSSSSSAPALDPLHTHPPPHHLTQSIHHPHHLPASHHHAPLPHHHQHHQQQHQHHPPPPILAKQPKRKKQKSSSNSIVDDFEMMDDNNNAGNDYMNGAMAASNNNSQEVAVTNEEDYPDMTSRDIEAARKDPEARPRKQKLRFGGDQYTPQWVRFNGQLKEGLCDTCKPGKWLQLKNSAYWYHKQFFHGISSVSGKEFVQPLETRWVDQDLVEGLCHQCHTWVAVSNVKRKNSVLWYRHAHKCHVYHKPKPNLPKKR